MLRQGGKGLRSVLPQVNLLAYKRVAKDTENAAVDASRAEADPLLP